MYEGRRISIHPTLYLHQHIYTQGDVPPRSALEALSRFDALVTKARADHDGLLAAKRALGLVFASGAVLEAGAGEQGGDAVDDPLKYVCET